MKKRLFISIQELKGMARQADEADIKSHGILMMAVMVAAVAFFGMVYRLSMICMGMIFAVMAFIIPVILFYIYYQKRENIRFNQVDVYIHQMSYSFQRNPKIITALKDTYQIAEGHLKETLFEAIVSMENEDGREVYQEALSIVERDYSCDRIYMLHRFIISIEERGGEYSLPMSILLEDFDRWVRRIYRYQDDMKHVKINSLIGIILSCILASMSVLISSMLNDAASVATDITKQVIYQAETAGFILVNVIYFVYVMIHYSRDWITPVRDDEKIMKDYAVVFDSESRGISVFKRVIIMLMLAVSVLMLIYGNKAFAVCMVLTGLVLYFVPDINKVRAMSRLKDDVYNGFSEWLREVAINLSHAPLQAAIQESYSTCPVVIKRSLSRFIFELDENPSDVTPYYNFLKEFKILDISSAIKTLYSITENGNDDMGSAISGLIRRKYEIVDKHEQLRNESNISVLRFAEYIPLLIVSVKIGIDMMLVITNYL